MKYYSIRALRNTKVFAASIYFDANSCTFVSYNSLRVPCVKLLFFQSKHLKQLKLILMRKKFHDTYFPRLSEFLIRYTFFLIISTY